MRARVLVTMLLIVRVIFIVSIYPAYRILTAPTASIPVIVVVNMIDNFLFQLGIGAVYAWLAEGFPKAVRSSGLAVLYAFSVAIFGGTTQFVVAWLIDKTKDPLVPAWYQIAANLVGIVGLLLMRRHPEVEREALGEPV